MRSTWPNSIRRQQYLFNPIASKASPSKMKYYVYCQYFSFDVELFYQILMYSNIEICNYLPSVYSACRRPRYASHLFPMTFPQVKQRIGIIMLFQNLSEIDQIHFIHLPIMWVILDEVTEIYYIYEQYILTFYLIPNDSRRNCF